MTPRVPTVPLATGQQLPLLGYGTWLSNDPVALREALRTALDVGYRLIDTAYFYQNEGVIGEVLQEYYDAGKFKREDIFITTKLPTFGHREAAVGPLVEEQLKSLHTDYIDLYLIHLPTSLKLKPDADPKETSFEKKFVFDEVPHIETWRALEALHDAGKLRALGLSNFNAKQIENVYTQARIKPANLQVELHVLWPQNELVDYCRSRNITVTAYAPLGSPGRKALATIDWPEGEVLSHPSVLAIAAKHKKTPAQVLLRQLIQRGISAIPKSTNPGRVRENFDVLNFTLDAEDLAQLEAIGPHVRLFVMSFAKGHKDYPFSDVA